MKLIDGIKLIGSPAEIPDCSRDDLPELFRDLGFKRGVEIGVYKGEFSEKLASFGGDLYSIDPWRLYKDYGNSRGQERLDFQYEHTKRVLSKYPNVHIIRKTSMEALDDFEDGSLDFVYIDGNHQFAYVAEDIYHWAIKVRQGGIIAGHDYAHFKSKSITGGCHAKEVVQAYVTAYRIPKFWVLGEYHAKPGEKRDQWRSWMFFKNHETPQHRVDN